MNVKPALAIVLFPAILAGCPYKQGERELGEGSGDANGSGSADQPLTLEEAQRAFDEVQLAGEATSMVTGTIEVTTNFTIGGAVQQAAEEIKTFVASQLPCAEITLLGNTLTVEYGAKPGNCTYHRHTYTGIHRVTVSANDDYEVLVEHEWEDLSNGVVSASGYADVTWSLVDQTRHVEHELTWTRLADGHTGTGSGDRLQGALDDDIFEGFTEDGWRAWEGAAGRWDLDIDAIAWRWQDPVPESGAYVLDTPNGKQLGLAFERLDEDSITVTVSGTKWEFDFVVHKFGGATPMDDAPDAEVGASDDAEQA